MVTAVSKKMNRNSSIKTTTTTTIIAKKTESSINGSISSASGFRLLIEANGGLGNITYAGGGLEVCETMSTVSKNSIYKQRIDAMFDDSRSIISQRSLSARDRRRLTSSVNGSVSGSNRHSSERLQAINENELNYGSPSDTIKNSVQEQIEKMFTDITKDDPTISNSFQIRYLGALPLTTKVTSLFGLQDPLRQLYLTEAGHSNQNAGTLDISPKGLLVKVHGQEPLLTPFQSIAVWSAVKFVVSQSEGGAAFLPLITDPENIDKATLFKPLSAADKRRLSSGLHSPLFAVVMKSPTVAKQLECHGFVCQSPEDAIVIAATLYQNLMAQMSSSQNNRSKKPKNRNGISCMSIASSSAATNAMLSTKSSFRGSRNGSTRSARSSRSKGSLPPVPPPARPHRKKRTSSNSLSSDSDVIRSISSNKILHPDFDTSSDEKNKDIRDKKKPPPLPSNPPNLTRKLRREGNSSSQKSKTSGGDQRVSKKKSEDPYSIKDGNGDILTKVAIPRSGSFLNTTGHGRYKSRGTRRNLTGKPTGNAGGGGSPLGFSELFNEFRLQENLHSLDDILNAIINSEGMSFNDLKPIYKEFLLKLAVTLTKDELYQRSKSIMRRQRKKKLKRKSSNAITHPAKMIIGAFGLKNVFKLGRFKPKKPQLTSSPAPTSNDAKRSSEYELKAKNKRRDRSRIATSGSEVSVHRTETAMNGHNRNSSSGYVSCSECSYDSDNCTCNSADRCYCSLGGDHDINAKLNKAEQEQRRSSINSCHSDDKCYCSMGETLDGSTTWCDSESCASESKCYCAPNATKPSKKKNGNKKCKSRGGKDNFALDYELFTVGSSSKNVKPTEALSVKKTVEMAAVFADVKLSQTTDITNLQPTKDNKKSHKSKSHHHKKKHDEIVSIKNGKNAGKPSTTTSATASSATNEIVLMRSETSDLSSKRMATAAIVAASKVDGYYQSVVQRPVSASLEDSLGYLP